MILAKCRFFRGIYNVKYGIYLSCKLSKVIFICNEEILFKWWKYLANQRLIITFCQIYL